MVAPPRVLIVDDEVSNARLVERWLNAAGYQAVAVNDAADALARIEAEGHFSAYVLDVMMPGMRGTELADVIRRDEPAARILYFTGFSDALFTGVRTLAEHEAFVQKPVGKRELLEAVSLLLFNDLQGPRDE
jgi:two-component system, cell cycle sensor histidine kinase and response regulator CckA